MEAVAVLLRGPSSSEATCSGGRVALALPASCRRSLVAACHPSTPAALSTCFCSGCLPSVPQGRNRRCITIDLHNEEGRQVLRRLANRADVLVEVSCCCISTSDVSHWFTRLGCGDQRAHVLVEVGRCLSGCMLCRRSGGTSNRALQLPQSAAVAPPPPSRLPIRPICAAELPSGRDGDLAGLWAWEGCGCRTDCRDNRPALAVWSCHQQAATPAAAYPQLGPKDLKPELIYTRISGYGQTGPKAQLPGYASVCEAFGGFRCVGGAVAREQGPTAHTGMKTQGSRMRPARILTACQCVLSA